MILGITVSFSMPEKGCTSSRNSSTVALGNGFGCIVAMVLHLAFPLMVHFLSFQTLPCAQRTSTHLSIMSIQVLNFVLFFE